MRINWRARAKKAWAELRTKRPELIETFLNLHYLGGGGCLVPHNYEVWGKFPADDVAYETLAGDCEFELKGR